MAGRRRFGGLRQEAIINHFPHHIGDYLKDTAHLDPLEDGIYRRALDLYYTQEGPLEADTASLCRRLRLDVRKHGKILDRLLKEFFTLDGEFWRHTRCDREIAAYNEGAEEREQKQAHEVERMRRYRERRKELFATLRERGIVPKWDTGIEELQRLANANKDKPVTDLQREQVHNTNAPATATQNQSHTQYQNQKENSAPPEPPPEPVQQSVSAQWSIALRAKGVKATSIHPTLIQWIEDKFTLPAVLEAVEIARLKKPAPAVIELNYLDRIVRDPPKKAVDQWWLDDNKMMAMAQKLGVPTYGKQRDVLKSDIQMAMKNAATQAVGA